MGIIYCVVNLANGKRYIGQTHYSLEVRWKYHIKAARTGSMCALHCAIRKYGAESFSVSKIDTASSTKELNDKEKSYIVIFHTLAPIGYNLTNGGDSFRHSFATRQKISKAVSGRRILRCKRGHLLDEVNTRVRRDGHRNCKTCCYLLSKSPLPAKLLPYLNNNSSVNF